MTRQTAGTQATGAARLRATGRLRACLVCLVLLAAVPALAQSGGGYDLSWSTLEGGGITVSTGGAYTLGGTAGQADAGQMAGGGYILSGGFWPGGVAAPPFVLYLPQILQDF